MNFMNVSFAETSRTFPRERENIGQQADGRDAINDPRNTRGIHFGTSPPIVSLLTIRLEIRLFYFRCLSRCRYIYGENMSWWKKGLEIRIQVRSQELILKK